ncbi:hydantoinase/oxoprolinase N-terminal domain-containing protein [Aquamicrobium segne]|uniref:Hydantoinase/oxoprolinase N-terminal domain-containing protein n=1 Tax=Aquamicrobium segne TaxID=469547 RepID=A0ABW0H021_9HYPH
MSASDDDVLSLGIDTGGTYTDAVLWSQKRGIVAKAKSLTTRHDLAEGIAGAADAVLQEAQVEPASIKLVSMSTTLATNALVEGQGGRVALVMIGFERPDLARDGLAAALGTDPVVFCPGGHDVHGNEMELALEGLETALPELEKTVTGVAVAAYFAVRNPAHEIAARDLIRSRTRLPVTCSHELTSKLGGPRRALTTLLNARLISMIERLIDATQGFLVRRKIEAPLMVVRGDGALVTAEFARMRPIETILSGPAASLVGARHLTGLDNAVVSDIGGTTTDIAVLDQGRLRLDPEGAMVGGMRTMVEAVAMRTFGLGGDSEVVLRDHVLETRIELGPRRLAPLSMVGVHYKDMMEKVLSRQLTNPTSSRLDGRFVMRTGIPESAAYGLSRTETRLYAEIDESPAALDRLLVSTSQIATLNRLVARGLVHIVGFTPSDAAHVLGKQDNWHAPTARLGAQLMARRRNAMGEMAAPTAEAFSELVLCAVTRRSAEMVFDTAFAADGLDEGVVMHPLVQKALERRASNRTHKGRSNTLNEHRNNPKTDSTFRSDALGGKTGMAQLSMSLDRSVIGLGASAHLHYANLPALIGNACLIAPDADVANALGAVVGQVSMSAQARVSQPEVGIYRLNIAERLEDFETEEEAMAVAEQAARAMAAELAERAGADQARIEVHFDIRDAEISDERTLVEAFITATATGRPRVAS